MNSRLSEEYRELQRQRYEDSLQTPLVACIDLEATCTDDPALKPSYDNEIIEFGIAILDLRTLTVVQTRQIYVRPTFTKVLPFCTALTGIKPETVADAPCYADALVQLQSFVGPLRRKGLKTWGSFGEYDRKQVQRQCDAEGLANPLRGLAHLNVKAVAQMSLKSKKGLGLARAVERLGLSFYGNHHSGVDDAVNVANVLSEVTRRVQAGSPL